MTKVVLIQKLQTIPQQKIKDKLQKEIIFSTLVCSMTASGISRWPTGAIIQRSMMATHVTILPDTEMNKAGKKVKGNVTVDHQIQPDTISNPPMK